MKVVGMDVSTSLLRDSI